MTRDDGKKMVRSVSSVFSYMSDVSSCEAGREALTPMKGFFAVCEKASEKPQKNHSKVTTAMTAIDIQIIERADFFLSKPA